MSLKNNFDYLIVRFKEPGPASNTCLREIFAFCANAYKDFADYNYKSL